MGFKVIKKHRWKILSGWLAFELIGVAIAMPAMANLTDRVELSAPHIVVVKELPGAPGMRKFQVASNAPFAVISEGQLSEISVSIETEGVNSQRVGPSETCAMPTSRQPTRIYTARDKTAARRGSPESQSIIVTIAYDQAVAPNLSIVAMNDAPALLALPCDIGKS